MSYPGEYPQPLSRKTVVMCPAISGYVTARLRAQDAPIPTYAGQDQTMRVMYENLSNGTVAFVLQACDDRSISGARTILANLGAVAGGHGVQNVTTKQSFLEVKGVLGTANLRIEIDSIRQWNEMGFAKDDPFVAPQLFQMRVYNVSQPPVP
jgi:hypothetical protein